MNCDPSNPKGAGSAGVVDIWQESFPVRFGAVDKSDRLTLDTIFNYFQEAAICHADNIGVGREDMSGQAWILSRMSVLVNRRPNYRENIIIRTWPRGFEKLFAIRNYQIKDKDGVPVVSARSAWLIVDIEKRRPLRPQSLPAELPLNEGLDALTPEDKGAAALAERNDLIKAAERKALYSDLDFNGHVNNIRYINWIEDSIEPRLLENADKMRLDINYISEILSGEVIELYSSDDEKNISESRAFAFEGRKKEGGQTAFRAELKLRA